MTGFYEDAYPLCLDCKEPITDPKRLKNPANQFCSDKCYNNHLKKIHDWNEKNL